MRAQRGQGSQFTSEEYKRLLRELHIHQSMDGKSRWADNIMIERWFRSLKTELIYINEYRSPRELRMAIRDYINDYNTRSPLMYTGSLGVFSSVSVPGVDCVPLEWSESVSVSGGRTVSVSSVIGPLLSSVSVFTPVSSAELLTTSPDGIFSGGSFLLSGISNAAVHTTAKHAAIAAILAQSTFFLPAAFGAASFT